MLRGTWALGCLPDHSQPYGAIHTAYPRSSRNFGLAPALKEVIWGDGLQGSCARSDKEFSDLVALLHAHLDAVSAC